MDWRIQTMGWYIPSMKGDNTILYWDVTDLKFLSSLRPFFYTKNNAKNNVNTQYFISSTSSATSSSPSSAFLLRGLFLGDVKLAWWIFDASINSSHSSMTRFSASSYFSYPIRISAFTSTNGSAQMLSWPITCSCSPTNTGFTTFLKAWLPIALTSFIANSPVSLQPWQRVKREVVYRKDRNLLKRRK